MERTSCAEDAGLYSAILMKHLNVQRGRGQFCDCVLRQNSDQVYPAHRCVLAASSPVLASILSSTGALVELQDPCLSDSVIVSLLDYIYTGILPSSLSQQQYHRLLTAARHLQMKKLQEALRAAWRQLIAEDISSNGAEIHTFGDLTLLPQTVQDSSNVGVFEEVQINSAGLESRIKGEGKDCNRESSCTLESVHRVGAHDEKDVPHFAQDLMQNGRASSEECDLPEANQEVHENEAKSSCFVNAEILQRCTEEKLQGKFEGRRRSSSSTSSHLCCGAVPVIRYSRRASVLQLAEAWEASQSSISSNMTPVSRSSSTDNDNTVQGVTTNGAESQDSRNHNKENLCIIHPDLNNGYSDYRSPNSNEQCCKGLTPSTDYTNQQALHYSSQSKDQSNSLKHQMESDFDQFPSKHRCLDCYEWNVSLTGEAKELFKNWGSVDPLPVQDSETGSDSTGEDGLDVEAKEEHDFSGKCLTETDTQDNRCDLNGPETNWYPNKKETTSIQQENKPNSTSTTSESGLDDAPAPRNYTSTKSTELCSCVENMTSGTIDYHGNLHYQWLPHQDAHVSAERHSKSSFNDSADEEEAGSFAVSPPREPDSVQTSVPTSLSVYKPSGLPAARSTHPSSPNHQPFQCSLCDRSFSQRGSLNRHVRSHLGVRPFPCPRCPMTFSRQYRVTEHMRVHLRCPLGNGH